jgi:hypothetical protein
MSNRFYRKPKRVWTVLHSRAHASGLFAVCVLLSSCASALSAATPAQISHIRLDSAGRALVDADKLLACHERAAREAVPCQGRVVSLAEWNDRGAGWERLRNAIGSAYRTVLAAEIAAARWDAGDKRPWNATQPCLWAALSRVRDELQSLGLPVPPALSVGPAPACNCVACAEPFYPYANPGPQPEHCADALACK